MVLIWDETLAEQVREQTQRAMEGQFEDMMRTADSFYKQADRHERDAERLEEQAQRLSEMPDIMRSIQRTGTRTVERTGTRIVDGNTETFTYTVDEEYTYTVRELDVAAMADRDRQIAQMRRDAVVKRRQAIEVRKAAVALREAAEALQHAIKRTNDLFRQLFEETRAIDENAARRMMAIKEDIAAYINKMEAIKNSFGGSLNLTTNNYAITANDVIDLMGMAVGKAGAYAIDPASVNLDMFHPTLAQVIAGVQDAAKAILDPINSTTGNFYYEKTDLLIPGRYPLPFTRFYNTMGGMDGVLGLNWTHNYNIRLYDNDEHVHIVFDDGHVETYTKLDEGFYAAPRDRHNALTVYDDGFLLHFQNLHEYHFNAKGLLFGMLDENGMETTLEYTDEQLTKVYNTSGSLTFSYNEENKLIQVTDHSGRAASFEYLENKLIKATQPGGATHQYEYNEVGHIVKITDPHGIASVQNKYDHIGRTVEQTLANGGVSTLKYDDERMMTIATEPNGNRVTYYRDKYFRTIKAKYDDFEENYIYDSEKQRTGHVDRNNNIWWTEFDVFGNIIKRTDPLGNEVCSEYNVFNKITKLTMPRGGEMSFTYDEYGNQLSSVDPLGRITRCKLDEQGRTYGLVLPDGSEHMLDFDERGNVTALKNSMGIDTQYEYDDLNRAVKAIHADGAFALFEYNQNGDVSKVTDTMGNTQTYQYNDAGRVTIITNFDGTVVTYKYDNMGNLTEIINAAEMSTTATFDVMQKTTSVTDYNGNTVYYEYDQYQRVVKTINEEGHATSYEHDNNGNVTAVIDALGNRTEIVYDALNRGRSVTEPDGAVTTYTYDDGGNLTQVKDALGNIVSYEYDLAGQMIKLTDPMNNITHFTYTALGQIETVTGSNGEKTSHEYYPGGRLKSMTTSTGECTHLEYDNRGNICKVTDTAGMSSYIKYDHLNRAVEVINAMGHRKKFAYDLSGNVIQATNENGETTEYKYSITGDVVEIIDALGHSTKYGYDNMSRLTSLEQCRMLDDVCGGVVQKEYQITTYHRNKKGDVITKTSPLGDVLKYTYDAIGRVTSMLDEDGLETLYTYNLASRVEKVSYADGKTVAFAYDALRRLTEVKDWLGITTMELDVLGRTTKTTDHAGNEVGYVWNAAGQKEKLIYPDGTEVKYEYASTGQLSKVIAGNDITTYTYDAWGRIKECILPDQTKTVYTLNQMNALTSLTHIKDGNILDQFQYTHDNVGNITMIEKNRHGVDADTGTFKYTYDPMGRLVEVNHDNDIKQYTYDAVGNRISQHHNGILTTHEYNAKNQLIQTIQSSTSVHYNYDKRGNLIQTLKDGQLDASYVYDAVNMMTEAFHHDKGTVAYVYNGINKRVAQTETLNTLHNANALNAPQETNFVLDIIRDYDNLLAVQKKDTQGVKTQNFIWGHHLLAAKSNNAVSLHDDGGVHDFYYLQDHLNSPIRLLHTDTMPLSYDEFGVPHNNAKQNGAARNNPFGFTGYQVDQVNPLAYAQARYYNPMQGRFASEDPVKDGLNWYDYCGSSPVAFNDPLGLFRIRTEQKTFSRDEYPEEYARIIDQRRSNAPGIVLPAPWGYRTSISFSSFGGEFGRYLLTHVPFVGDFLPAAWDSSRYVGGPSVHMFPTSVNIVSIILDLTLKGLAKSVSYNFKQFISRLKSIHGLYKYTYGFYKFMANDDDFGNLVLMDGIAEQLFTSNNIPTHITSFPETLFSRPHVAIHMAERLLTQQMMATYNFIAQHSYFFFGYVLRQRTFYCIMQELSQLESDAAVRERVDLLIIRATDMHFFVNRNNPEVQAQILQDMEVLRQRLYNFQIYYGALRVAFISTIQKATCAVLRDCQCVPPLIAAGSGGGGGNSSSTDAQLTEL